MNANATGSYNNTARTLHWLIAAMVILLLIFGRLMEDMAIPDKEAFVMVHSGAGILIFLLMIGRFAWRQQHPPPPLPAAASQGEAFRNRAAGFVHLAFYVLVILQCLFGMLQAMFVDYQVRAFALINISGLASDSTSLAKVFHVCHGATANLLTALILLHLGAALYHHFHLKDEVLGRMLPFVRTAAKEPQPADAGPSDAPDQ